MDEAAWFWAGVGVRVVGGTSPGWIPGMLYAAAGAGVALLLGAAVMFCRAMLARASMMAFGASVVADALASARPGRPGPGGGLPIGVVESSKLRRKIRHIIFTSYNALSKVWGSSREK